MTKSPSTKRNNYPQHQLNALEHAAGAKIESLMDLLGLDLRKASRFYVGTCPVHGGSNKSAFNIFHVGDEIVGNWRCFTHGCQDVFCPSLIGFVRGYLSRTKYGWCSTKDFDKECPFHEAVEFLTSFTGSENIDSIKFDMAEIERYKFSNHMSTIYARDEPKRYSCFVC